MGATKLQPSPAARKQIRSQPLPPAAWSPSCLCCLERWVLNLQGPCKGAAIPAHGCSGALGQMLESPRAPLACRPHRPRAAPPATNSVKPAPAPTLSRLWPGKKACNAEHRGGAAGSCLHLRCRRRRLPPPLPAPRAPKSNFTLIEDPNRDAAYAQCRDDGQVSLLLARRPLASNPARSHRRKSTFKQTAGLSRRGFGRSRKATLALPELAPESLQGLRSVLLTAPHNSTK